MKKLVDQVTFKHGATINNRLVQSPMLTSSGHKGEVSKDTLAYWQARSNSAGMMITEYNYVSEAGGPALTWDDNHTQLAVYDDKFLPGLKKLASTMKAHGNKAILQIAHTGREANYRALKGEPVYAPDTADYPFLPYGVQAFTTKQVEEVVKDFGKATKRAIEAGFDGVEIHGANHYLIQQFFSRFSNHRTDKWGQAEAFPMAVAKEVMATVKKYAKSDFIIGYRISPEEINPDNIGYTWHDSTKLIGDLTSNFDFDYIHLSLPDYNQKPSDSDLPFSELFKPYLGEGTKLIIVGDVHDAPSAEDAMSHADLVAVARAQIIDANFSKKILENKDNEIIHKLTDESEIEQKLTPGLRMIMDKKTNRQNFGKMISKLDYSKAIKVNPD